MAVLIARRLFQGLKSRHDVASVLSMSALDSEALSPVGLSVDTQAAIGGLLGRGLMWRDSMVRGKDLSTCAQLKHRRIAVTFPPRVVGAGDGSLDLRDADAMLVSQDW